MIIKKLMSHRSVFAAVLALALASLAAASAFAAGAAATRNSKDLALSLQSNWKAQASDLHTDQVLSADIAKWSEIWLKDKMTIADKTTASRYVTDFNTTLRQAEALSASHAGFNNSGQVTDSFQAGKTITSMSDYLHQLHIVFENVRNMIG
jgi:hypothetical protein